MAILSQIFLYLAFAFITGVFLFTLVPEDKKPAIRTPRWLLVTSILAIPLLSFIPLLEVIFVFYQDIGFWQTFQSVVFTFEVGQSWLVIVGVSLLLFVVVMAPMQEVTKSILGLLYTGILILAIGWASHAASIASWSGFLFHSAHFLSVSVWIGILLMVAWFSRDIANWRSFLGWFHPVAIGCVLIILASGVVLMFYGVTPENYLLAWILPYGQALLVKHLFVVPLLFYAFINGVLIKRRLAREPEFNPKPWTKVETVVVFFIFTATAVLGQAAPPHQPERLLNTGGTAWLFQLFHPEVVSGTIPVVNFSPSLISMIFLAAACLFLALLLVSFSKKFPAVLSLLMSVLAVVSGYLALMSGIQI